MKLTVEPLIGLGILYLGLCELVKPQYIFQRFAGEMNLSNNTTNSTNTTCSSNVTANPKTNNITLQNKVAAKTSVWMMYLSVSSLLPSIVTTLAISSWGDHVGRRYPLMLTFIGFTIENIIVVLTVQLNLPLFILVIASIINGICGGYTSVLSNCFAYIADISTCETRTIRIAFGEAFIGCGMLITGICTGFLIQNQGFTLPLWSSLGLNLLSLFYIKFSLKDASEFSERLTKNEDFETTKSSTSKETASQNVFSPLFSKKPYSKIYECVIKSDCKEVWLMMVIIFIQCVSMSGSIDTIYRESSPFCWSPQLIGMVSSLSSLSFLFSLLLIRTTNKCMGDFGIIYVSIFSSSSYYLIQAFATKTWHLIAGTVIALFSGSIITVMRSMISRRASPRDQGSYFAIVALLESLAYFLGGVIKNSIFTATISWWSGFVYMSAVLFQLFNLLLITVLYCMEKSQVSRQDYEQL